MRIEPSENLRFQNTKDHLEFTSLLYFPVDVFTTQSTRVVSYYIFYTLGLGLLLKLVLTSAILSIYDFSVRKSNPLFLKIMRLLKKRVKCFWPYMLVVVDLVSGTNGFPIRFCSGGSRVPPLWATGTSLGGRPTNTRIQLRICGFIIIRLILCKNTQKRISLGFRNVWRKEFLSFAKEKWRNGVKRR